MHSNGALAAPSIAASPTEVAHELFRALACHDAAAIAACFAPDGVQSSRTGGTRRGRRQIRSHFAELFAACPDLQCVVIGLVEDGDRAIVRYQAVGTVGGSALGGPRATGERVRKDGIETIDVTDGLIQRLDRTLEWQV